MWNGCTFPISFSLISFLVPQDYCFNKAVESLWNKWVQFRLEISWLWILIRFTHLWSYIFSNYFGGGLYNPKPFFLLFMTSVIFILSISQNFVSCVTETTHWFIIFVHRYYFIVSINSVLWFYQLVAHPHSEIKNLTESKRGLLLILLQVVKRMTPYIKNRRTFRKTTFRIRCLTEFFHASWMISCLIHYITKS